MQLVDEFRSTICCSCCGERLLKVYAPPTRRQVEAHEARALRPLPNGWVRPAQRPLPAFVAVRGLLWCANPECAPQWRIKSRDADACRLILERFLAESMGRPIPICLVRGTPILGEGGRFIFSAQ